MEYKESKGKINADTIPLTKENVFAVALSSSRETHRTNYLRRLEGVAVRFTPYPTRSENPYTVKMLRNSV